MSSTTNDRKGLRQFYMELVPETLLPAARVPPYELEFNEIPVIHDSKTAVYINENIPGRSEPWKSYAYSDPTSITFTTTLVAQGKLLERSPANAVAGAALGLTGRFVNPTVPFLGIAGNAFSLVANQFGSTPEDIIVVLAREVYEKVNWLKALLYPQTDEQGRTFPPPQVYFHFGANFVRRGVVTHVGVVYEGPYEVNTLLSYAVKVEISFEESNRVPRSYLDVRNDRPPKSDPQTPPSLAQRLKRDAVSLARSKFGL